MSFVKNYIYAWWLGGSLGGFYGFSWKMMIILIITIILVETWREQYWQT